ncbi:MAG: glycosyltransferase family 39 protein [Planctomycetota bacterium]
MTEPGDHPRVRMVHGSLGLGLLTLLVVIGAVALVVASHGALSHTVDEPTHMAVGMQWLQEGSVSIHAESPPLGRVTAGLGPHLRGLELPAKGAPFRRGTEVLYARGAPEYQHTLAAARLGTLPWLLLAAAVVWAWARRRGGAVAAAVATTFLVTLPPMLGHAGMANTDLAMAAAYAAAVWGASCWLERPTLGRSVAFGLGFGLALCVKYSALVLFPPCFLALALLRWLGRAPEPTAVAPRAGTWLRGLLVAGTVAVVLLWASYGFAVGAMAEVRGAELARRLAFSAEGGVGRRVLGALWNVPLPAPEAGIGLLLLVAHASHGHPAYLLGQTSQAGFWLFYPVALLVKTPLPFLMLLATTALALCRGAGSALDRRAFAPLLAGFATLAAALPSSVNIGLRHVLVVYPLFAVSAGLGAAAWLQRAATRGRRALVGTTLVALIGWQVAIAAVTHPHYLAYFNPLAGSEPGELLVDSDLDWGQDLLHLAAFCRAHQVPELHVAYFGSAHLCEHGLPPLRWLPPGERVRGWVAVSEMYFRDLWHQTFDDACDRSRGQTSTVTDGYGWLRDHELVGIAGRSIRVYRVR